MCVVGRRELANFKVPTADNSSDDPSREVELRNSRPVADWLRPLLSQSELLHSAPERVSRSLQMFREAFAGGVGLSRAVSMRRVPVGCSMEPFPQYVHGKGQQYVSLFDLSREKVVRSLFSVNGPTCV